MSTPQSWYEYAARALRPEPRLLGFWTADRFASPEQVEAAKAMTDSVTHNTFTVEGITWTWRPA